MKEEITMLEIGNTLISLDVLEKEFHCDLEGCHGACCVEGESGAPLEDDEKYAIEEAYPIVREYMTDRGIATVEEQGWYVVDSDGDTVTPLVDKQECAYCYNKRGVTFCAIEKAWLHKRIDFRKPVSCHLYPVRITKFKHYDAINYEEAKICKAALVFGRKKHIPLYHFLKDAFTRKYGKEWYEELEIAAVAWRNQKEQGKQ